MKIFSILEQLLPQTLDFVHEVRLQGFRALEELRLLRIVVPAIVEDLRHVADELAQRVIGSVVYFILYFLQIHRFFDDLVVVGRFVRIDGFHEGPRALVSLYLFDEFPEAVKVLVGEVFHIGVIHGRVPLAIGTDVLVDVVSFGLQDADTPTVEPVLTTVAANVELRFIVGLPAEAKQFLRVARVFALRADELGYRFAALLGDADAVAVEPVVAEVASHVELGLVVGRPADAVQLLLLGGAAGALRRRRRRVTFRVNPLALVRYGRTLRGRFQ